MVLIYFVPQIFEYLKKFDTNLLSHRTPGSAEVETLFSPHCDGGKQDFDPRTTYGTM